VIVQVVHQGRVAHVLCRVQTGLRFLVSNEIIEEVT
jgi:hypothetical protein